MLQNQMINFFTRSIIDDDFSVISISPGSYKIERLKNEYGRSINDEENFTEADYPFTMKPNFSTLGSNLEISR